MYGLPVGVNKLQDLSDLRDELNKHGAVVRLLIDHEEHVTALETFESNREQSKPWSVFVKIDNAKRVSRSSRVWPYVCQKTVASMVSQRLSR